MNNYQAGRKTAMRIVVWQAVSGVIVGLLFLGIAGPLAGLWALVGGAIGTIASLIMALLVFGRGQAMDAAEISNRMFRGESLKFVFTVVTFVLIFVLTKPLPMPLFVGYALTFLVYWIALSRAV